MPDLDLRTATLLPRDRTQRNSTHVGPGIIGLHVLSSGAQRYEPKRAVTHSEQLVLLRTSSSTWGQVPTR
jgi:hypothetical protein